MIRVTATYNADGTVPLERVFNFPDNARIDEIWQSALSEGGGRLGLIGLRFECVLTLSRDYEEQQVWERAQPQHQGRP